MGPSVWFFITSVKDGGIELLKLDTNDGNVKIKGHINSIAYIDGNVSKNQESVFNKLFK